MSNNGFRYRSSSSTTAATGRSRTRRPHAGIPPIGVELRTPDLAALAVAMGARGVRTTSTADLPDLVGAALGADGPTLIHFDIR